MPIVNGLVKKAGPVAYQNLEYFDVFSYNHNMYIKLEFDSSQGSCCDLCISSGVVSDALEDSVEVYVVKDYANITIS